MDDEIFFFFFIYQKKLGTNDFFRFFYFTFFGSFLDECKSIFMEKSKATNLANVGWPEGHFVFFEVSFVVD